MVDVVAVLLPQCPGAEDHVPAPALPHAGARTQIKALHPRCRTRARMADEHVLVPTLLHARTRT